MPKPDFNNMAQQLESYIKDTLPTKANGFMYPRFEHKKTFSKLKLEKASIIF